METIFKSRLRQYRQSLSEKYSKLVLFSGESFTEVYPQLSESEAEYVVIKIDQKDFCSFIKSLTA